MTLWRRFRRLRPGVQVAVWLTVALAYTAARRAARRRRLGRRQAREPARELVGPEKRAVAAIEGAPDKGPRSATCPRSAARSCSASECEDASCTIVYATGLPGNGRIVEDQQAMLARLYRDRSLER